MSENAYSACKITLAELLGDTNNETELPKLLAAIDLLESHFLSVNLESVCQQFAKCQLTMEADEWGRRLVLFPPGMECGNLAVHL